MNTNTQQQRSPWLIPLVLFIVTIVSRLPFQSQYLYHFDSVNMAFGIRQFDVLAGAPQVPGYIVYIALAQLVNFVVGDAQRTMLIISILSSGLAVVSLYYLGKLMFNATTGLVAAIFLMTSPLVWFYGEIALPHTLDLLVAIVAALALFRIMQGERGWLWWATAVLLSLIGGFRQQSLMFLAPMTLFAVYRAGIPRIIGFGVVAGIVGLMWFVPLMAYSGGMQAFFEASGAYSRSFFETTSLLDGAGAFGLIRNARKLGMYTLYGLALTALPLLYWVTQIPKLGEALRHRTAWFLGLWIAPALAFYLVIHMGQQGLVFIFLPALLLISAEGLVRLFATRESMVRWATAGIALVGSVLFVVAPTYPLGNDGLKLLTASTLRENDSYLSSRIAAVRENFDPEHTLLVANTWRHFQYYLPEYELMRFFIGAKWEANEGQAAVVDHLGEPVTAELVGLASDGEWNVVFLDPEVAAFNSGEMRTVEAGDSAPVSYLTLAAEDSLMTDGASFTVQHTDVQTSS